VEGQPGAATFAALLQGLTALFAGSLSAEGRTQLATMFASVGLPAAEIFAAAEAEAAGGMDANTRALYESLVADLEALSRG